MKKGDPKRDIESKKSFAQDYLGTLKPWYYEGISTGTSESFILAKSKLVQLLDFVDLPKKVVSVGVGGGEEVCMAVELFAPLGATIYGLDLSTEAIDLTKKKLKKMKLEATLIEGDATDMPFDNNSISVFIESSILHEIYSYAENGKDAWRRNISEVAQKLSENGLLLLRDFAAPDNSKNIEVIFSSEIAISFYRYFKRNFRVFEGWDKNKVEKNIHKRILDDSYFPPIGTSIQGITLPLWKTRELLLHFRIFYDKYTKNLLDFNDPSWKEINETYLPLNPDLEIDCPMSQGEYVSIIINTANNALEGTCYQLICVKNDTSNKQESGSFFREHFSLKDPDSLTDDLNLYSKITEKMELIFKKIKMPLH